jgi:hypothetical protein
MNFKDKGIIWINSTVLFLLSYMILYTILGFATLLSASAFDFTSELFYYQAVFYVRSYDWSSDSVKGIYSTAPLIALFIGILLFVLYTKVKEETGLLKLLVLWMIAHCMVFFFGDMMVGALFSKGFGYVIMYLYFMDTGKMIITLFALGSMFTLGILMGRYFLYSANSYLCMLPAKKARTLVVFQFLLPFLTGYTILALIKIPEVTLFDLMLNASLIIFILAILIRAGMVQDLYFEEEEKKISIRKYTLIGVVVLLALFRIVLGYGIKMTP